MKKIERLKLNQLSRDELKKRELNQIKGGDGLCCGCGCHYFGDGGSSIADNWTANHANGQTSYGGDLGCGSELPISTGGTC